MNEPAHAARRWATLAEALEDLTATRATGALHVEGANGGSIYLVEGEVYYVHTDAAPGVDCLLQASGTVPPAVFQTAWAAGAAAGQVGEVLIKSGALSRGEAELCTAAAITDGAFALLTADSGPVHFSPGDGHWWGALRRVGVASLDDLVRKRRRLLEQTQPTDLDDQPVVATRRLGRHHVVLTDLQWELVVHADGRRTARELARLLGRSAFSVVLESRRLAAAGLVAAAPPALPSRPVPGPPVPPPAVPLPPVPEPTVPERTVPERTVPERMLPEPAARESAAPRSGEAAGPEPPPTPTGVDPGAWRNGLRAATGRAMPPRRAGSRRPPEGAEQARRPDPTHPMPLPRRQPGATLNGALRGGPGPAARPRSAEHDPQASNPLPTNPLPDVPEPDQSLLARVRTALEGLR